MILICLFDRVLLLSYQDAPVTLYWNRAFLSFPLSINMTCLTNWQGDWKYITSEIRPGVEAMTSQSQGEHSSSKSLGLVIMNFQTSMHTYVQMLNYIVHFPAVGIYYCININSNPSYCGVIPSDVKYAWPVIYMIYN